MELDIGKHCEVETCHQLDYCPFFCKDCNKNFCLDHRTAELHDCPSTKIQPPPVPKRKKTIIKCDICNKKIENHIITPYKCSKCGMKVCNIHRYLEEHNCISLASIERKNPAQLYPKFDNKKEKCISTKAQRINALKNEQYDKRVKKKVR